MKSVVIGAGPPPRPVPPPAVWGATLPGPMASRVLSTPVPIDLGVTLAPLRHGPGDPTMRIGREVWRTTRTATGPVSLRIAPVQAGVEVEAWGPGAADVLERAPALVGLLDDAAAFSPMSPLLRRLLALRPGLRLAASGAVMEDRK